MTLLPPSSLATGQEILGFEVRSVTPLPAFRAVAVELRHVKSGARVLHVRSDDSENLFSVNFPTPPTDDSGLPHILEHAVLGGSARYRVKDPFFEMANMSMATFINAMTAADCTYYPVASNVKQDLFNLAEVYCDAVFHPLLTRDIFMREGHHLTPVDKADPASDLTIGGIVYNEMKGAFSNPESVLIRFSTNHLFPDTIYGHESGGDPRAIPDLTYEDFKQFHETWYHPSNAFIVLYGDIATEEYLAFLSDKLDAFDRRMIAPKLDRQPRWTSPRRHHESYGIGRDEPIEERTYMTVNWIVGDAIDPVDTTNLYILSLILLGNEGAPLKKAIIDSKLGHDMVCYGFSPSGRESTLHVGLKGTEADRLDRFETLVHDTLARIAAGEIANERVEAAFQQASYEYREISTRFPIEVMYHVMSSWPYGSDPLTFLNMNEHLAACRERHRKDPRLFQKLIQDRLIDNPHRLSLVLSPDRELKARREQEVAHRMQATRARLSAQELELIAAQARELERQQSAPNDPAAVASLPQLAVSDLPRSPRPIPHSVVALDHNVTFLRSDVFSNGVAYIQLDFDLQGLPLDLHADLPIYLSGVSKLGAAGVSYEEIAHRRAAHTGGIAARVDFHRHATDAGRTLTRLRFIMKTLDEEIEPALALLGDLIFRLDPRSPERLEDILVQARSRCRTQLVHSGSNTAAVHAARGLSLSGQLNEAVFGLPQLAVLDHRMKEFRDAPEAIMGRIEALRSFLANRQRLTVSFTGSDRVHAVLTRTLSKWLAGMSDEPVPPMAVPFTPLAAPPRDGLAAPIEIAHCVQIFPAPDATHPDEPLLAIGAHLIDHDYMLTEIRFKGNAYGAWCRYDPLEGSFTLGSYQDPHVTRTLDVFAGVLDFVKSADWNQADVDRAIIGTAKNAEKPIRPSAATGTVLFRHLTGLTQEYRERRYGKLLTATPESVRNALVAAIEAHIDRSAICVVSNRDKLEQANAERPDRSLAVDDILKSDDASL